MSYASGAPIDAQEREIEKLKAENEKLRKSVRSLLTCIKHEENAKLRDLVREMLPPLLEKDCLWCVHHWNNRGDCTGDGKCLLKERAKELGIDVPDE
jgi:hypothetical protein